MQITTEKTVSWFNEQPKPTQHEIYTEFYAASKLTYNGAPLSISYLSFFPDWLLLSYAPVIAGALEAIKNDWQEVKRFSFLTLLFIALLAGLLSSCNVSNARTPVKRLVVLGEQITANDLPYQDHYAHIVGDTTGCLHIVRANDFFGEGDTVQAIILQ